MSPRSKTPRIADSHRGVLGWTTVGAFALKDGTEIEIECNVEPETWPEILENCCTRLQDPILDPGIEFEWPEKELKEAMRREMDSISDF